MFCDVTRRPGTYSTCNVIRGILFTTGTQIVIGILFPNGESSIFCLCDYCVKIPQEDPGKNPKYRFSTWVYVGIFEIGIFLCGEIIIYVGIFEIGIFLCGENCHLCRDFQNGDFQIWGE